MLRRKDTTILAEINIFFTSNVFLIPSRLNMGKKHNENVIFSNLEKVNITKSNSINSLFIWQK